MPLGSQQGGLAMNKFAKCSSCQAQITWLKTPNGKYMPIDGHREAAGLWEKSMGSHWETCPTRQQHKRKPQEIAQDSHIMTKPAASGEINGVEYWLNFSDAPKPWSIRFWFPNGVPAEASFVDQAEAVLWAEKLLQSTDGPSYSRQEVEGMVREVKGMHARERDALLAGLDPYEAMRPKPVPPARARVAIYTDGSNIGQPGPGGWAALLIGADGSRKELSGPMVSATNNQAELTAVIKGLEALRKPCDVELWSDSKYVVNGISMYLRKWAANGWRSTTGDVKNRELWERIHQLCQKHQVKAHWVKGHNGQPENERVDELAGIQSRAEKERQSKENSHIVLTI